MCCLQVGRSKCSECFCCAGRLAELTLVVGVSGVRCLFVPGMLGGGCCVGLSDDVAPREGTVNDGWGGCLAAPKVCWGFAWS